jgi:enoyl-CoA hydratase/carnithine racemase
VPFTPDFETLAYEERNGVAYVTLNRPAKYNAISQTMRDELKEVWATLRRRDAVKCVVLSGAGDKAFCTGIDRDFIADGPPVGEDGEEQLAGFGSTPFMFDDPVGDVGPKTNDLWKPVIGAINGMACGGAFYMLGECDFLIAAEHATFFDPHVTAGMAAAYEPIQMLNKMPFPEIVRLTLLGSYERMSSNRAREIGLVSEVVPGEGLREASQWAAEAIASAPALAVQATLRALWAGLEHSRSQSLAMAYSYIAMGSSNKALAEGQAAFASGKRIVPKIR